MPVGSQRGGVSLYIDVRFKGVLKVALQGIRNDKGDGLKIPRSILSVRRELKGRIKFRKRAKNEGAQSEVARCPSIRPDVNIVPIVDRPLNKVIAEVPSSKNVYPCFRVGIERSLSVGVLLF